MLPLDAESNLFPFARSIIKTRTEHLHQPGNALTERYFISSKGTEEVSPESFGAKVRAHWNIENGSHRQRDTLWREDHQPMRHHRRAHILSTLRQVALHLHSCAPNPRAKPRRISHQAQAAALNISSAIALLQN